MRTNTSTRFPIHLLIACFLLCGSDVRADAPPNRITILYDAFGKPSKMQKDWGFSALIEYGGKRILFDTGNSAEIFARNAEIAGVDLKNLDFAVISHRHLDHTAGLTHLQAINPTVKMYAPQETAGLFGSSIPARFFRRDESLPDHMRYYDSEPPETVALGTAWPGARFETMGETGEIAPGMFLIALVSDLPGTKEMRELSLAIKTPAGLLLVVGCSHPGIERIAEAATAIDPHIYMILGGFHLPSASDEEIARIATAFREDLKVEYLAPGHCTGEPAFALFVKTWGKQYIYAGLGTAIDLP